MKLKTVHKIQIAVFSLTLTLGCFLFITHNSYGSEIKGTNSTIQQITIPYDANFLMALDNRGIDIKVEDSGKYHFQSKELGIKIAKKPTPLQAQIDKNPEVVLEINTKKFENTIKKIAEAVRTDQKESSISIINNELIYSPGGVGKVMVYGNAFSQLISELKNGHRELVFHIVKLEENDNEQYTKLKNEFKKIKQAQFWLQYDNRKEKINSEQVIRTLKISNNGLSVNRAYLRELLNNAIKQHFKTSIIENHNETAPDTIGDIEGAVSKIINDIETNQIQKINLYTAHVTQIAGTDGKLADRYIEVDLSQQKLYTWKNRKVENEYRISSGAYDRTPIGEFAIKNKAPNTFSSIYEKFMPYWMAFAYLPEYGAYAGFHELTYWQDEQGNYVYESDDRIGQAVSGGCIRLARGKAEEFYNWAQIGDKVLIHE